MADMQSTEVENLNAKFESDVRRVCSKLADLIIKKHHDYGPKNIANSPGGALNGLRVRMHDKLARINNLIDNNVEPSNEPLRDSFVDLAGYSIIAILVEDGKWPD